MSCCDPNTPPTHWSAAIPEHTMDVGRVAFHAVRRGERPTAARIGEKLGRDPEDVSADLRDLVSFGEANLDADGRVVAVAGLSVVPARHRLELDGQPLHTWCAYDAVGIPAALGADATARTTCAWCDAPIEVRFTAGRVDAPPPAVLWFPALWGEGDNPQESWCPEANLFCGKDHLEAWRSKHHTGDGEILDLEAAASRGAVWWGAALGASDADAR